MNTQAQFFGGLSRRRGEKCELHFSTKYTAGISMKTAGISIKSRPVRVRKWSSSSVLSTKCKVGTILGKAVSLDFSRTRDRLDEEKGGRGRRGGGERGEEGSERSTSLTCCRYQNTRGGKYDNEMRSHVRERGHKCGRLHLFAIMPHELMTASEV